MPQTKSKRQLRLKAACTDKNTDYYLEVASEDKYATANSMRHQFGQRFEIAQSVTRKCSTKKAAKKHERIGRARERYPSVHYYYDIDVALSNDNPILALVG